VNEFYDFREAYCVCKLTNGELFKNTTAKTKPFKDIDWAGKDYLCETKNENATYDKISGVKISKMSPSSFQMIYDMNARKGELGGYMIAIYIALIEHIVIWFVTWLQLPTKTQETKWIKTGIFYLTFFEGAIMILIATAPDTWYATTNGRNTDFTTLWYQ
jgi:hypothetical protein